MFFRPCGVGRMSENDNDSLDLQNNISTTEYEEQRFDDKYTNSIFESEPLSTSQSALDDPYTIFNYRLMTQTPDYEQNVNNMHVRHVHWPY